MFDPLKLSFSFYVSKTNYRFMQHVSVLLSDDVSFLSVTWLMSTQSLCRGEFEKNSVLYIFLKFLIIIKKLTASNCAND